ncbi:MAG: undecaprenyl-diphosphate phosphatase [Alistipes sp.]|nr:undecaprenyl-diphosphate phosphatase [Candidatus Alistipes equi]
MDTLQAIILGIIQGLTEFLPVSSSGHLQLMNAILGTQLDPESNVTFDLTLHLATVLSTIVVFWPHIVNLCKDLFKKPYNPSQQYIVKIIISMIPVGIVGFCFMDLIEKAFSSILVVGIMLLLTALLLLFAHYAKERQRESISYRDSFLIGIAQAFATMPGLSRSGTTIATGLMLGNRKDVMTEFSFLMVLPPIIGNSLLDMIKGDFGGDVEMIPLICGFLAAFISGYFACRFMIGIVRKGKLSWFAAYCAIVGVIAIIVNYLN